MYLFLGFYISIIAAMAVYGFVSLYLDWRQREI